jgi:hypothetical protein
MPLDTDELFVEITRIGVWRRVAVLDPASGAEAVVHGPAHASDAALLRLAKRRLDRRPRALRRPEDSDGFA